MVKPKLLLVALAVALVSGAVLALAQTASGKGKPGASDLAWLAGSWRGTMSGSEAQEVWSKPEQGSLMGMFRLRGKERTSVYEFLLIEEEADGLYLRFQHIGPGYKVWEKDGPLEFRLTSSDGRLFVFESPDPKQAPTRITYGRLADDKLTVTVETVREGAVKDSFDVAYERAEAAR